MGTFDDNNDWVKVISGLYDRIADSNSKQTSSQHIHD
jgi:hypothetical protein